MLSWFSFSAFWDGVPVIDLLSLCYKFTLFAYSVKMNLTPLNTFQLTPDTAALSVEEHGETSQNKVVFPVIVLICHAPALSPVSFSAHSFTAWLLLCILRPATSSKQLPLPWQLVQVVLYQRASGETILLVNSFHTSWRVHFWPYPLLCPLVSCSCIFYKEIS